MSVCHIPWSWLQRLVCLRDIFVSLWHVELTKLVSTCSVFIIIITFGLAI